MIPVEVIMEFKRHYTESDEVSVGRVSTKMSTSMLLNVIHARETKMKQWLCLAYLSHYLYQSAHGLISPWILQKDSPFHMVRM